MVASRLQTNTKWCQFNKDKGVMIKFDKLFIEHSKVWELQEDSLIY